jgi:integrator complex subunit 9
MFLFLVEISLHDLKFVTFLGFLQTCLSKGSGFHFPPCHMLNFCGIRILFDCPLDLSALVAFSPIPTSLDALSFEESNNNEKRQKVEDLLDAKSLIFAEPWYKTVNNLHLWNASLIDVILISSPMGIMGLPFLTRRKGFSAKVVFLFPLMLHDLLY